MSTFEPTMGITQTDMMVMSSYGNGPAGSTAIISCDLIGMVDVLDYNCENVYDPFLPIANSNDPYIYVDPWTSRIMKFDMHALLGMTVEWSDDEGASWQGPSVATQVYSVQDHQTIASSNMPAALYETTWMFCINGNAPHPLCSSSQDGGATWGPETSGAPVHVLQAVLVHTWSEALMGTSIEETKVVLVMDILSLEQRMQVFLGLNMCCQHL